MFRIPVPLTTIEQWFGSEFVEKLKDPEFEFCSVFNTTQSTTSTALRGLSDTKNCIVTTMCTQAQIVKKCYSEETVSVSVQNKRLSQLLVNGALRLVIAGSTQGPGYVDLFGITGVEYNYITKDN